MKSKTAWMAFASSALMVTGAQAATGNARNGLVTMQGLNVIVLGDFDLTGGEVEGKTFVRGNLTGNNAQYGFGNGSQGQLDSFRAQLTVGGNVTQQSIKISNGSNGGNGLIAANPRLVIGGSAFEIDIKDANISSSIGGSVTKFDAVAGSTTVIGGNASNVALTPSAQLDVKGNLNNISGSTGVAIRVDGTISGNQNYNGATRVAGPGSTTSSPVTTAAILSVADQIEADVTALATALGNLTVATNLSSTSYDGNNLTFNAVAGSEGYALFEINAGSTNFFNATQHVFTGATNIPIIVNVRGLPSLTINANNNNVAYNQSIIWNFLDTTSLTLTKAFHGSILAPKATISGPNTSIEGSVVAKIFTHRGEVHLGTYARSIEIIPDDVGTVPEPGTWALLITGFGLTGAAMRRRRTVAA